MTHAFIKPPGYTGLAHELDPHDARLPEFQKQVDERGWDDTDTWCLRTVIAMTLAPRLRRFKDLTNGSPADLTEEAWQDQIEQMIRAFELIERDPSTVSLSEDETAQVEVGLDIFRRRIFDLWW